MGDNGVYEVTGAQPTPAARAGTDLAAVARGCGIERTFRYADAVQWEADLPGLLAGGLSFVALDLEPVPGGIGPRSPGPAAARARRFQEALAATG